ncbi:MAG: adenylate kinase [Gemmataceae bacterium]|nr:adenylate kinase [Gemmataceae bacterium]
MRLIFIGPPGSGKGTQAKLLSQRLGLIHFATGDILREAIRLQTPEGKQAHPYMSVGKMVPDSLINAMVDARFRSNECPNRFVMDGYPRNLAQAVSFDAILNECKLSLDAVIFLRVADEEIVKRLSARWNCPNPTCKATYNTQFKPPKSPGICDDCGSPLMQREDDKPETIQRRLGIFHELTNALLDHYRNQGLLVEVPGIGEIDAIYRSVEQALAARKR